MRLAKIGKYLINLDRIDYVHDDSSNHVKVGAKGTKNEETGVTSYSIDDCVWHPYVNIHFSNSRGPLSLIGEDADTFLAIANEAVSPKDQPA